MKFHQAIAAANQDDRMGLIVYVVPYYPNPAEFENTLFQLDACRFVSIVETTIPTIHGFSEHANDTIRRAHIQAYPYNMPKRPIRRSQKPSLCVLYRGTVDESSFEKVLNDNIGQWDGLILEWSEDNEAPFVEKATHYGIELVQCVGPWMSRQRIREILLLSVSQPLVYLMSAPKTGATLFDSDQLTKCIETIRMLCPEAKIAAGFGIRNANDIQSLSTIEGLDAVIIGTAFLETMNQGPDAVSEFLGSLEEVLYRRPA